MVGAPILKAFAYITHRDAVGERLLVFSHPRTPEAGIQVPAGTVQDGETPAQAALREAVEETGLSGLAPAGFLGEQLREVAPSGGPGGEAAVHHRHFFHFRYEHDPPVRWRRVEAFPSDASAGPRMRPLSELPLFELFWARLPDGVPVLAPGHGAFLPLLVRRLHRKAP